MTRPGKRVRTSAAALLVISLAACSTDRLAVFDAIGINVSGIVQGPSGPVANARVFGEVIPGMCSTGGAGSEGTANTNAEGRYTLKMGAFSLSPSACVRLTVTPPAGQGLNSATVTAPMPPASDGDIDMTVNVTLTGS